MKKRLKVALSLVFAALVLLSAFVAIENSAKTTKAATPVEAKKPFYVGVTYCGESVIEAEQLIDYVKNYTNLFVLQSGPLMDNLTNLNQICSYAVQAGLNIIVYFANNVPTVNVPLFISSSQTAWGNHFLGVYYCDEPGGKMLDSGEISISTNNTILLRGENGAVEFFQTSNQTDTQFAFYPSGIATLVSTQEIEINVTQTMGVFGVPPVPVTPTQTTYYPNGTISCTTNSTLIYEPNGTVLNQNGQVVTNQGNISQFEPYKQVLNQDPLLNNTDAANLYVSNLKSTLSGIENQTNVNLFTSDYGLYWFDYLAGYNTVFAEQFGTKIDDQALALVKGAADMQRKSYGVMIEPSCQSPLTLQTGNKIYNELKQAYEDGAEYAAVFNYSPYNNATGLLQDQQFNAIQKFWTDILQNPKVTNNVKGQDALVLPSDYGYGFRSPTDTIWGIWPSNKQSQQVWNAVQTALAKYGSKLDIVFEEPTAGQYQHTILWNQTQ